jgi:glycosyltransferase involved in cell wall biosynthesis
VVESALWERADLQDKIVLAYAGSVKQGKDAINNVIRALALLGDVDRSRFVFWLAGSDRDSVVASLGVDAAPVLERTEAILDFKGFLPRAQVQQLVAQADYTVLLRPDAPYANAGFPTKFGESLVLGVPVIANLTSDLATYLHDGVEGYVVPDDSPTETASTLLRILATHTPPNREMRTRALATGRGSFDLRTYAGPMMEFLGLTRTTSP